jgi:hypothetical protein
MDFSVQGCVSLHADDPASKSIQDKWRIVCTRYIVGSLACSHVHNNDIINWYVALYLFNAFV